MGNLVVGTTVGALVGTAVVGLRLGDWVGALVGCTAAFAVVTILGACVTTGDE